MSQSAHLFLLQRDLSLACLGSRKCTTRLLEQKLVEPSTLPACYQRKGKIQVFKGLEFIKYRDPSAFCMKFNTSWMILSYLAIGNRPGPPAPQHEARSQEPQELPGCATTLLGHGLLHCNKRLWLTTS